MDATQPILMPDGPDQGLPWHYGDPLREQRRMTKGYGAVVLGNRDAFCIDGTDRLIWLGEHAAEPLADVQLNTAARFTMLDGEGRVCAVINGIDNGRSFWGVIDRDMSDADRVNNVLHEQARKTPFSIHYQWWPATAFIVAWVGDHQRLRDNVPAVAAFKSPIGEGRFIIAKPQHAGDLVDCEGVGIWAYEALRIAARQPRIYTDTDAQTTPAELGAISGRANRRLQLVHLDGSADDPLPPVGTPLTWRDRPAGRLGSTAQHYELGPIGLALVSVDVPDGATLLANQTPLLVAR